MMNQLIDEFYINIRSSSHDTTESTTAENKVEKMDLSSYLDFLR